MIMKAFALTAALALAALAGAASTASADHWQRGGGHGRWWGGYERSDGFPGRGYGYDWRRRWVERHGYPSRLDGYYGDRRERWISRYRPYSAYGYDRY
jgi:opacity protein-like surface antigen